MRKLKKTCTGQILFKLTVSLRIASPFLVFKDPVLGLFIVWFLDLIDGDIASLGVLTKKQYQEVDKALDFWWYTIALIWSFTYLPNYFTLLSSLFLLRLLGTVMFYVKHNKKVLFFFANYYENVLILLLLGTYAQKLSFLIEKPAYYYWMALAIVFKIAQEYWLHIANLSIQENLLRRKRVWIKKHIQK